MEWEDLVTRVSSCAALDRLGTERAIRATVASLVEALSDDEAEALMRAVPDELRALIAGHALCAPLDRNALFANDAVREAIQIGFAAEHVRCVCSALVERLPNELVVRLCKNLPALAPLFALSEATGEPPLARRAAPHWPRGRPGSRHPLSDAGPNARTRAPSLGVSSLYADAKLSSARGPSQEREGRTIARAKPPGA